MGPPEPSSLALERSGALAQRIREALGLLGAPCRVCPRLCTVDRLADERGLCRIGRRAMVASHFPHFGEEDCLRGSRGSGTIFFSGCNLRCVFCQNYDVSWQVQGEEVSRERLAGMMLELQALGCHNINWVTPEHVVPQILEALPIALAGGLRLPIVYNTSSYELDYAHQQHSAAWRAVSRRAKSFIRIARPRRKVKSERRGSSIGIPLPVPRPR
jgi:putative pyruvate formate lyase activating enzyme